MLKVKPILQLKAEDEATPLQPTIEKEEEEKEEEEVVEVPYSRDNFEVFNQLESLEVFENDFSHLPLA